MFTLPTDIQKLMCDFLGLREINVLYCLSKLSKEMFEVLTTHTNFIINAKVILTDEQIEWFETRNIKLKLLETYKNIYGVKFWCKNGKQHRDNDLPAVILANGDQHWYKNGNLHRDNDLPAVIMANGDQKWFKDGKCHRDNDLPAVIRVNGDQLWFKDEILHRDNGPAVIIENGDQLWYKNGKQHRDNGPAVILANGYQLWYKNGKQHRDNINKKKKLTEICICS